MLLGGTAIMWPLWARAQTTNRIARIGFLSLRTVPLDIDSAYGPFLRGLRDRSYVEGQTIVIEDRRTDGQVQRLADFAAEMVRLKVDVTVADGPLAIHASAAATTMIPKSNRAF